MRFITSVCFVAFMLLWPLAGPGFGLVQSDTQDFRSALVPGGEGTIAGVMEDGRIILADGRVLVLDGIEPALKPLAYGSGTDWALFRALRKAILDFGGDAPVSLYHRPGAFEPPMVSERYGGIRAYLTRDGRWLQLELLSAGLARLAVEVDKDDQAMWAAEDEARLARHGLWRHPAFAVSCADDVRFYETGYKIIQGRVKDVARVKKIIYLNFGTDWREDFTVRILEKRGGNGPALSLAALEQLEGRQIEVRGWLFAAGGPMIEATYPGQIRLLETLPGDLALACQ